MVFPADRMPKDATRRYVAEYALPARPGGGVDEQTLGSAAPSAQFFVFYCGVASAITPPVAIAA